MQSSHTISNYVIQVEPHTKQLMIILYSAGSGISNYSQKLVHAMKRQLKPREEQQGTEGSIDSFVSLLLARV